MSGRLRKTIRKKNERKNMKSKSMKRKSMKRKNMKHKSMKHKSMKHKSMKRKNMKHDVRSYHHKYLSGGAAAAEKRKRAADAAENRRMMLRHVLPADEDAADPAEKRAADAAGKRAADAAENRRMMLRHVLPVDEGDADPAEKRSVDTTEEGTTEYAEVPLTGLDDTVEKAGETPPGLVPSPTTEKPKCHDWHSQDDVEVDEYLKDEGNFIVVYQTSEGEVQGTLYGEKLEISRMFNSRNPPENPQHIRLVAGRNIIVEKPDWFDEGTDHVIPSPKLFKLVPRPPTSNTTIYDLELLTKDGPEYKEIFSEACKGAKVVVKEAISEVLEEKNSGRKPGPSIVKKLVNAKAEYQRECGRRWPADIKNEEAKKESPQREKKAKRKAEHDKKVEQDLKIRELVDIGKRLCSSEVGGELRGPHRSDSIFKFLAERKSLSELIRKMGDDGNEERDILEQIKAALLILVNDEEIKRAIVGINSWLLGDGEVFIGYLHLLINLREKIPSGWRPNRLLIKLYKEIEKELQSIIEQIDPGSLAAVRHSGVLDQPTQMVALFNGFMVNLSPDIQIFDDIFIRLNEVYIKHLRDSTPPQSDGDEILDKAILDFIAYLNPKIARLLRSIEANTEWRRDGKIWRRWSYTPESREGWARTLTFYYEKLATLAPDYTDEHNSGKTYKKVWDSINNERKKSAWRSSRLRSAFETLPDPTKFLK